MTTTEPTVAFTDLPTADLHVGTRYLGGETTTFDSNALSKLLPVGNQGGIRFAGSPTKGTVRLCVLYTTGAEQEWPNEIDSSTGVLTYYGDNRSPGKDLHDTSRGGNLLLRDAFAASQGSAQDRLQVPPFLLFEKATPGRSVRFRGLVVPGVGTATSGEDLVVEPREKDGQKFYNYRASLTILDTNEVLRAWLDAVLAGEPTTTAGCPRAWQDWVETGIRTPLVMAGSSGGSGDGASGGGKQPDLVTPLESVATPMALENPIAETFETQRPTPQVAHRREAALQKRYSQHLTQQGHKVCRHKITVSGEPAALYTDLFDLTTGELVEAKADSGRATIRLALGQILDYSRHVEHRTKAILVPDKPSSDLLELLRGHQVAAIWETDPGHFQRLEP